ncbi:MAG: hypothetical protein WAV95_11785 [Azonexus sp.]
MTHLSLNWPQSAGALLDQAKQGGDLVKLIMAGTHHLESWLIENRILPLLQTHQLGILRFEAAQSDDKRSASLAPLPDGSAFACNTDGLWSALASQDALLEIEHIGARFAPGDHWQRGFVAFFEQPDNVATPLPPLDVARLWEQTTGTRPGGFELGTLDQMEAFGLGIAKKLLHTQSRLGL